MCSSTTQGGERPLGCAAGGRRGLGARTWCVHLLEQVTEATALEDFGIVDLLRIRDADEDVREAEVAEDPPRLLLDRFARPAASLIGDVLQARVPVVDAAHVLDGRCHHVLGETLRGARLAVAMAAALHDVTASLLGLVGLFRFDHLALAGDVGSADLGGVGGGLGGGEFDNTAKRHWDLQVCVRALGPR